jgi:hypothetical protein
MLRITVEKSSDTATVKLAGKLTGPWIEELDRAWVEIQKDGTPDSVLLDLCEVTFVAPEGRERLECMYRQGARFKTSGCFGKSIVEEIMRSS